MMHRIQQKIQSHPHIVSHLELKRYEIKCDADEGCCYRCDDREASVGACSQCWEWVKNDLRTHFTTMELMCCPGHWNYSICPVCWDPPPHWGNMWVIRLCGTCNTSTRAARKEFPAKMLLVRALFIPELAAAIIWLM